MDNKARFCGNLTSSDALENQLYYQLMDMFTPALIIMVSLYHQFQLPGNSLTMIKVLEEIKLASVLISQSRLSINQIKASA